MRRLIILVIVLAFVCGSLIAAQAQAQTRERATFTVGTATAARGQKATGTIEVPAGSDAALSIPVAVFHGAKPGPVLALVSGAHGTEYTSIIAPEKLIGM
jgi:predicted deacylase